MRFDLNLATRIYLDRRKVNATIAIILALLVGLLFAAAGTVFSTAGEIERIKRETSDVEKRVTGSSGAVADKELKEMLEQVKSVNAIIDRKTLNWVGLLDRLEAILPEGVAVTSLEPDTSKQALKISLVARNFPLLRRSLESFEESRFFTDVFLLSQNEVMFSATQKGVGFTVSCRVDYRKL
jgi:type IV pilus assembly protein PilN